MSGLVGGVETSLSKMFEAVGARKANIIDDAGLEDFEQNTCPGCGSCSGMYTANSMNCLCEAVGIALPGNGTIPAVHSGRIQLAQHAGMAIMNLVEKQLRRIMKTTDDSTSSLSRDFAAGRAGELGVFCGDVVRMADEAGVDVPVTKEYYQALLDMAAKF